MRQLGGVGPFWRPQHWGASTLSSLYFEEGDIEKGVAFSLEWVSAISPDGWAWGQNATIADRLAQHGYWEEAVVQYQLALKGIRQEIVDKSARWERLYEMGDIRLPPNFTSWEESFETAFRDRINEIEEALERAKAQLPITTSIALEGELVERGEQAFLVGPSFPNPFNASTVIRFSLPHPMEIRMTVVNLMGQEIRTLVEGYREGGGQQVVWDGADQQGRPVASGLYLCRLRAEELMATRKLLLLR